MAGNIGRLIRYADKIISDWIWNKELLDRETILCVLNVPLVYVYTISISLRKSIILGVMFMSFKCRDKVDIENIDKIGMSSVYIK